MVEGLQPNVRQQGTCSRDARVSGLCAVLLLAAVLALGVLLVASPSGQAQSLDDVRAGGVEPGDCLVVDTDPEALLSNLPGEGQPDPENASQRPVDTLLEEARDPASVPIVCQEPMNETMRELVREGNRLVEATRSLRDTVNTSFEAAAGTAEIPFLFENFTAERIGGLGNWTIESASDEPGFVRPDHERMGDGFSLVRSPGQSYPPGVDTALVSPAIDLGGTLLRPDVASLPQRVTAIGEAQLREHPPGAEADDGSRIDICLGGSGTSCIVEDAHDAGGREAYQALRQAYLDTAETLAEQTARDQARLTLEIRHRFNLAHGLDGVRYEVLTEDPSNTQGIPEGTPITPDRAHEDRYAEAAATNSPAFTGNTTGWTTHSFDLAEWAGERVWILARAQTVPSFFQDIVEDRLASGPFYGYAMEGAYVNATVAPRNLRVLDVDTGQVHVDGNWTLAPPLSQHDAQVAVTNQGTNRTTADVHLEACTATVCRTEETWSDVELRPGDVEVLDARLLSVGTDRVTLRATIQDTDEADHRTDADPEENELVQPIDLEAVERLEVHPDRSTGHGLTVEPTKASASEARRVKLEVSNAGNLPVQRDVDLQLVDAEDGTPVPGAVDDPDRSLALDPGEPTQLTWTVNLPSEGVYRLEVAGLGSSGTLTGPQPSALVYADRSPGVVCADDTHRHRACGQTWTDLAQLPRVDEDERMNATEIRSAALTPGGTPIVLTDDGEVLAFEDGTWNQRADDSDLIALVTDGDVTLAIAEGGTSQRVTANGLAAEQGVALDEVHALAVHREAGILALGEGHEAPAAVAAWQGTHWRLVNELDTHPEALPGDVAIAPDGTPTVALLQPTGFGSTPDAYEIRLCQGQASGNGPFTCPELDEETDRLPLPEADRVGERAPTVELGAVGNRLALVVEAPIAANGTSPCADATGAGTACLLWLPGAGSEAELTRPVERTLIEPGLGDDGETLAFAIDEIASTPWARQPGTEADDRLRRLSQTPVDEGLQVAGVPVEGPISPLGGGPSQAAAVVGTHFVATADEGIRLEPGNGWHPHARLLPQTADRVVTTTQPEGVGDGAEKATASGPPNDVYLRASCADVGVAALVERTNLAPTDGSVPSHRELTDAACLEIDPFPLGVYADRRNPDAEGHVERNLRAQDLGTDELNLDVRYNLREIGNGPPEVRLVLQPTQKIHHDRLDQLPNSLDPEGELVSTGDVARLYPVVEEQTNTVLGCLAGGPPGTPALQNELQPACTIAGAGGTPTVQGDLDEEDRFQLLDERTRSPHVLTVDAFETTGEGWQDVRLDLAEKLREKGLDRYGWRLLGLEFAFPQDTQMALDAVWMNRTTEDEREVLLFTDGKDVEGTWKRSMDPDRWRNHAQGIRPEADVDVDPSCVQQVTDHFTPIIGFIINPSVPPLQGWVDACQLPDPGGDDVGGLSSPERKDIRHREDGFPTVQSTPYATTFDDGELRELTPSEPEVGTPGWHLSPATSRPAWAFMEPAHVGEGILSTEEPVRDRLVTPVVDLRDAERPTLSFEHAYGFDTDKPFEGMGWVEAQVETEPGEFSQWIRLRPEGGYPGDGEGSPQAFHGHSLATDRNETWGPLLDAEGWQTETFNLIGQERPLDGHRVRFAFHAVFADEQPPNRPHQGWVVSGLRVESDRPEVDLAVEEAHVDEAFNATETGLPPGENVDLNVTIDNEGDLETGPRRLDWEIVAVGSREEVVERGARPLPSLAADERTWVSFSFPVPSLDDLEGLGIDGDSGGVYVRLSLAGPQGVDEDPTDDRLEVGSPTDPFRVRETRSLDVRVQVLPADGPIHRSRTVQTFLNNTGNVPLDGIHVDRNVEVQLGTRTEPVPAGLEPVLTSRDLPAGEEETLTSLAPEVGVSDILWDPPQIGSYLVRTSAVGETTAANAQVRATASEAALFSSVEDPVRGEAAEGTFQPGPAWTARSPGAFGSAEAFHLDASRVHVGEDGANLTLRFPPVDLTTYRRAEVSFVHNFAFERAFDGGAVQASTDGGETWHTLHPSGHDAVANGTDRIDVTASGNVYTTVLGGNPMATNEIATDAFTGSSEEAGPNGWVSSTFDVSQLGVLREPGEVANWSMEDMEGNSSRELPAPAGDNAIEHVYHDPSWAPRPDTPTQGFLVENRTHRSGDDDMLYTGSAREQFRAHAWDGDSGNFLATYEIELPDLEDPETQVHIVWQEWGPTGGRDDTGAELGRQGMITPFARALWFSGSGEPGCMDGQDLAPRLDPAEAGDTLQPRLVTFDGETRHYMTDVTPLAHADEISTVSLGFMTHPWYESLGEWTWGLDDDHAPGFSKDHPGFAVEDLRLKTFQPSPAGAVAVQTDDVSLSSRDVWELEEDAEYTVAGDAACPNPDQLSSASTDRVFQVIDETASVNTTWHAVELGDDQTGTGTAEDKNTVLSTSAPREHPTGTVWDAPSDGDTRLVLPPLDLSSSGENVTLSFDHVPAFGTHIPDSGCQNPATKVGGGVVEISVFDPAQNEWGEWKQIYSQPDAMNGDEAAGYDAGAPLDAFRVEPLDGTATPGCLTPYPFELHDAEFLGQEVKRPYLYNNCIGEGTILREECSQDLSLVDRWRTEDFELSEFADQRVRVGFHAFFLPFCNYEDVYEPEGAWSGDADPDEPGAQPRTEAGEHDKTHPGCPVDGSRWLLDNVTVHGEAFRGEPVSLRLSAGLDGSIHNASWAVDDVGIVGERYEKNVGLYLDNETDTIAAGETVTVEGEIRNMGAQTRRDIVVQATLADAPGALALGLGSHDPTQGSGEITSEPVTLEAGEISPLRLDVTAGTGLQPDDEPRIELQVLRLSSTIGTPTALEGEAVTTNLDRVIEPEPRTGELHLGEPAPDRERVAAGAATTVELPLSNPAEDLVRLAVDCTVVRIQSWLAVDHATGTNHTDPVGSHEGNCQAPTPEVSLAAEKREVPHEVSLPRAGVYEVRFEVDDVTHDRDVGTTSVRLWAGDAPRLLFEDFANVTIPGFGEWSPQSRSTGSQSYSGSATAAQTTQEASQRGNSSVLIGISRDEYERGETYATEQASRVISPPVDLHNLTDEEDAALTFYHMGRFAYGDGADVKVRTLENEPEGGWSSWCKMRPEAGYEGFVSSYKSEDSEAQTPQIFGPGGTPETDGLTEAGYERKQTADDINPAQDDDVLQIGLNREHGFYGSQKTDDGDRVPRWEESWNFASFPLSADALECEGEAPQLHGRAVQFAFTLYAGKADDAPPEEPGMQPDPLDRGRGQGWYLDSVVVSTGNANQTPRSVRAPILDAAPKDLPIRLENEGPLTELVSFQVDPDTTTLQTSRTTIGDELVVPADNATVDHLGVEMPRKRLGLSFQHQVDVTPDGLIDPNEPLETSYELPFHPRSWGDLSVTVHEPEDAVVEAVPALVPVEVTNDGLDRSEPTDLVVRIGTGEDAQRITASVPSLPPAQAEPRKATTEVFVPWTPEQGSAGEHTVTAEVDPDGELEEYTKADNTDTRSIDVQPLRIPDLGFAEDELTVRGVDADVRAQAEGTLETYSIPSGSLVRISVPVVNTGNSVATLIDVRLFYGSLALPAERIDRLAPGESQDVAFTFVATDDTRELSLEVTSGARDLDPTDNAAPSEGTLRLEGLRFDIDVASPDVVELADPGDEGNTTLSLTNRAGVGVLVELVPHPPAGFDVDLDTNQLFLEPGRTTTVGAEILTTSAASGGTHPIDLEIREIDNGSNAAHGSLPVRIEPDHALDLSTSIQRLDPGTTRVPLTLTNDGNLDEHVELVAQLAGTNVSTPATTTVPRDLPRTLELDVSLPPGTTAGNHQLTIYAEGTITRTWNRTVEIPARSHLELQPDPAAATLAPDGLRVPIHTENAGTAALSARLIPDPLAAPDGTHLDPEDLELGPGETSNVSLVAPATTTEPIPLTVDGPQGGELAVPVPGAETDLVLLRQTVTPEDPEPGTPVELRATVANTGVTTVQQVPVDLFIDEEFASRVTVEELVAGDSATVTFEWPAFAGEHLVTTVVDPDGSFPDIQPDNDRANLHLAAGDTGLLAQLLRIPGPGALLVPLLALTAALIPRIRSTRRGGES